MTTQTECDTFVIRVLIGYLGDDESEYIESRPLWQAAHMGEGEYITGYGVYQGTENPQIHIEDFQTEEDANEYAQMMNTLHHVWQKFIKWYKTSDEFWCSEVCKWLKKNHLKDALMMGYYHDENPTAKVGESEGGHDFLILNGKYIVDFWYRRNYNYAFPLCLPLERASEFFGEKDKWEEAS